MVSSAESAPGASWFNQARFGMFIHWGPYAVAGRGEWVANRERIPLEEYRDQYASRFLADRYQPEEWAELAVKAGMRYAVLTTRHHDGFSLWPTECTDFHAGYIGPKQDLVGPFVEAFRKAGLKVGMYYSPADWFHDDYPGSGFRDWPSEKDWASEAARARFMSYVQSQIKELMTWYGPVDYLWYDGVIPEDLKSPALNQMVLDLQPDILINERNGPPCHVRNSEQAIRVPKEDALWEACMTLNENWGYHAGDQNWKNSLDVIKLLTETAAGGGNLLLNVGPKSDGVIPSETVRILGEVGEWMNNHGDSIYGSDRSPFSWNNWGRVTVRGNLVYLHIWNAVGPRLCLAEIRNAVQRVRTVIGSQRLSFKLEDDRLWIDLPETQLPDCGILTIEIEVDGSPEPVCEQTSFWIPGA